MLLKNKVIRKTWGNLVIASGVSLATVLGIAAFTASEKEVSRVENLTLTTPFAAISALFLVVSILLTQRANEVSNHFTREYLKQAIKQYPSLQSFKHLLYDEESMANISAWIVDDLDKEEFQKVLDESLKKSKQPVITKYDYARKMLAKQNNIIEIVKQHATKDPEFLNKFEFMLAKADYDLFTKEQKQQRLARSVQQSR